MHFFDKFKIQSSHLLLKLDLNKTLRNTHRKITIKIVCFAFLLARSICVCMFLCLYNHTEDRNIYSISTRKGHSSGSKMGMQIL